MTTPEAIKILKSHNRWRRGADIPMICPVILGEAIDQAVAELSAEKQPVCDHKNSKGVNQLYSYYPDCMKHID